MDVELCGKVILINLWVIWCGFCLFELFFIDCLVCEFDDCSDIVILIFNVDCNLGFIVFFLEKEGYVFEMLFVY